MVCTRTKLAEEFTQPYTPPAKTSWRAEVRLQGKLQANRGCVTLQRRGCRSNSGLEILRRTRSFPERTRSAGSVAAIFWQLESFVYREGCIAARRPTVWARRPVLTGCGVPGKGGNGPGLLPGLCPQKAGPRVANYWPLYKALRHGDRLVGPELSLLAHRVLDTLRRDFHEDAALQHRARVRVEDLVKRASAPLKPFEHEVRRANLRHVVQVVVEFRQVLHRDDPERLRRHLHVVVATFDGGWQVGRQSEEMLQRVHSPALGADVAAADLKLVQEQRPLVTQEVALDRGSQHVRAGHHHELVQVFPLPLSP